MHALRAAVPAARERVGAADPSQPASRKVLAAFDVMVQAFPDPDTVDGVLPIYEEI